MRIGIGSYKGIFVTKKTGSINEGIFTTCHEIGGAAMAQVEITDQVKKVVIANSL